MSMIPGDFLRYQLHTPKSLAVLLLHHCMHVCPTLFCWAAQPLLHNGLAVCHMKMGEWEDAERDLQEALGKDAKDADTLANLITVSVHAGRV